MSDAAIDANVRSSREALVGDAEETTGASGNSPDRMGYLSPPRPPRPRVAPRLLPASRSNPGGPTCPPVRTIQVGRPARSRNLAMDGDPTSSQRSPPDQQPDARPEGLRGRDRFDSRRRRAGEGELGSAIRVPVQALMLTGRTLDSVELFASHAAFGHEEVDRARVGWERSEAVEVAPLSEWR